MSQPYPEAMVMHPEVTYTPYATSLKEQTGDVITFAQFEEGNILPSMLAMSHLMISYLRRC